MRNVLCLTLAAATIASPALAAGTTTKHRPPVHRIVVSSGIGVMMDQARLITFSRPAKTVFVANPTIADVNIVDSRHAFVLGKTFGLTNLIALDSDGKQIENKQITVINHEAAVTLNRGPDQYNMSCMHPRCEFTPRPGDPSTYFDNTEKEVSEHQDLGMKNATGGATGQQASAQ